MKTYLIECLKGIVIGVANIIPGVSGGTMAVAMGIYDRLIKIVGNIFHYIFKEFKSTVKFLMPLGIGALIGIVFFSKLIEFTLEKYNMQTIFLFIGLILGTMPIVFKSANKKGFKIAYLIPCVLVFIFMVSLLFITNTTVMVFDYNLNSMLKLFGLGVIAAGTMIIPGISGSFVLMLLGAYVPVLGLVTNMKILLLLPFGLGVAVGIIAFSKAIDWLIEKFYGYSYYAIIGFVIGSIALIFGSDDFKYSSNALIPSIICLVIGLVFSYFIGEPEKLKKILSVCPYFKKNDKKILKIEDKVID